MILQRPMSTDQKRSAQKFVFTVNGDASAVPNHRHIIIRIMEGNGATTIWLRRDHAA